MTLSNLVARKISIKIVEPAAKLAEFFIKIGLVLLCIELSTLGAYGVAGLMVVFLLYFRPKLFAKLCEHVSASGLDHTPD